MKNKKNFIFFYLVPLFCTTNTTIFATIENQKKNYFNEIYTYIQSSAKKYIAKKEELLDEPMESLYTSVPAIVQKKAPPPTGVILRPLSLSEILQKKHSETLDLIRQIARSSYTKIKKLFKIL